MAPLKNATRRVLFYRSYPYDYNMQGTVMPIKHLKNFTCTHAHVNETVSEFALIVSRYFSFAIYAFICFSDDSSSWPRHLSMIEVPYL